jgi:hypothetical protein
MHSAEVLAREQYFAALKLLQQQQESQFALAQMADSLGLSLEGLMSLAHTQTFKVGRIL